MRSHEIARAMHQLTDPITSVTYFAPEMLRACERLEIEPVQLGYFGMRAAPLGACSPATVAATFYNFSPVLVEAGWNLAMQRATPDELLLARAEAIEAMFERLFDEHDLRVEHMVETTELAYQAMRDVPLDGRPLAAANAAIAPRGLPLADLWQALTTLREYRGDGHVALLVAAELSGPEAVVLYQTWAGSPSRRFYQSTRGMSDEQWDDATGALHDRGLLAGGGLSPRGREFRDQLEADTDRLAAAPWRRLGEDAAQRLHHLILPMARAAGLGHPRPYEVMSAFPGTA